MRILKIVAEGVTTSFRYPHFMQQIHPSFHMPPPATIYGHICSALGEWVDPTGVQFAYRFTHQGEVNDMEHIIILGRGKGKLPGTKHPKVLEGRVNPFERQLLFLPRLTLYLNRPEWEPYFRSPHYAVVLGRSQDLFTYTHISTVDLQQANQAYFEYTIAPYNKALQIMRGITTALPRFLDYYNKRTPQFGHYLILKERVMLNHETYWIDPTSPEIKGCHLGLFFHSFTGEENVSPFQMA